MLSKIIDIENVLSTVDSGDIYKIGIDFFSLMNYPVKKLDKVVNSKLDSFLAYHMERRVQFSPYEYEYLRNIRSISGLFTLIEKDIDINNSSKDFYEAIHFLTIDLICLKRDRSLYAYYITKILNKAYAHPTFILMHHDGCIVFTSQLYDDYNNENSGEVYLSDWYNCYCEDYEKLIKLTQISFENHSQSCMASLYKDMIYSIAREYYIYKESYEYLSYGYFVGKASYFLLDSASTIKDHLEQSKEHYSYYHQKYGEDYFEEEHIEILLPEEDDLDFDEFSESMLEEFVEDEDDFGDYEDDEYNSYDLEINGLKNEDFKDPLKILDYIERLVEK